MLKFKVFGFEIASLELILPDNPLPHQDHVHSAVETVVEGVSDWWIARMFKRRNR